MNELSIKYYMTNNTGAQKPPLAMCALKMSEMYTSTPMMMTKSSMNPSIPNTASGIRSRGERK